VVVVCLPWLGVGVDARLGGEEAGGEMEPTETSLLPPPLPPPFLLPMRELREEDVGLGAGKLMRRDDTEGVYRWISVGAAAGIWIVYGTDTDDDDEGPEGETAAGEDGF
jgi:hypothetical protein